MGRRNSRGLELSFKPVKGSRGRWYKKIEGQAVYYGWGDGVTDRESYQAALGVYRAWRDAKETDRNRMLRAGLARSLQHEFSVLERDANQLDLAAAREKIERLRRLGSNAADLFGRLADSVEKDRLIEALNSLPLEEIRAALANKPAMPEAKTTGQMLDDFLAVQRQRMERRQKLDQLRQAGQEVQEAAKQNLSPGRFGVIAWEVAAMKKSVGSEPWDGTEACAARVVQRFREESDVLVLDRTHSPHTFNERIKVARMFCAWAEASYQLDRLPRDRSLFSKYTTSRSTAKAIPREALRKLWMASDNRGRCWLLLGLNCACYAQDISDLTAESFDGQYLNHVRGKTGVKVRYKLWKKTQEYLKQHLPKSGRVFGTDNATPLVHYSKLKKSGEPVRVDNVRNWFFRLCKQAGVTGFSFSNLRDTGSTEVEKIDRSMNDLFLAHRDPRMAALYVDGEMVDTTPLDRVIDQLERRLDIWTTRQTGK